MDICFYVDTLGCVVQFYRPLFVKEPRLTKLVSPNGLVTELQGYLADKKRPPPLEPP